MMIIDGHDFSDLLVVNDIVRPLGDGPKTIKIKVTAIQHPRQTLDSLNALITGKTQTLTFLDQPERDWVGFFVGNPTDNYHGVEITLEFEVESGLAQGQEKTIVVNSKDTVTIYNNGTATAYPTITFNHTTDNGFVAISNGEQVYQYGDPTEVDTIFKNKNVKQFDEAFKDLNNWTDYDIQQLDGELYNAGSFRVQNGDLYLSNPYTAEYAGKWHGKSIKRNLTTVSTDWRLEVWAWQAIAKPAQNVMSYYNVLDDTGQQIAGIMLQSRTNERANYLEMFAQGMGLPSDNASQRFKFADFAGRLRILKKGGDLIFDFYDQYKKIQYNRGFTIPELADSRAASVVITHMTYSDSEIPKMLTSAINFWSYNAETDIENGISAGDVLEIDMNTGKAYKNGAPALTPIAYGSQQVALKPGVNILNFSFSKFARTPEIIIKFREAYK